jgi:hypothetical protein
MLARKYRKKEKKPAPVYGRTKVLGVVVKEYVQHNVPDMYIQDVIQALSNALLSDHYARSLQLERVTEID